MIYAVDNNRDVLVEFKSQKEMDETNAESIGVADRPRYRPIAAGDARAWVLKGWTHETGLWVDEGRVRYAKADPEGH